MGARHPQPERRQLTVMFCDLVGSTELSRRFDPEDLLEILKLYRDTCTRIVADHGGYVSRFMGDGMLCLFGYPEAEESSVERAVYAALMITEALPDLRVPRHEGLKLSVRIGMATGVVIAGDVIGEGPSREEAVFGETPNLASRLQTLAAPNSVVISNRTRKLLQDAFDYRFLGDHTLKGFDEPVQAWEVLGASDAETRFDAAHTSSNVALVNRTAELQLMDRLWEEAKTSSGRVLLMGGEAGIGKSRLAKTLLDRIASELGTTMQLQCSPHYQFTALHPLICHLERAAGFQREDTVEAKRSKLRRFAGDAALPAYERLFSLSTLPKGDNVVEFSPKRQRDLIFATVLRRLRELASKNPILVVVEDAHWMDPTSVELLTFLIDNIGKARVFVLVTYRPEFTPIWADRPNTTAIALEPLDRSSGEVLAKSVFGDKTASSDIIEKIVARTEGIPLFIEELVKSFVESGTLEAKATGHAAIDPRLMRSIPISLMDSLMARIDRLGEAKTIAQISAVVGAEFPYSLLERVVLASEPDLETALPHLVSSGILLRQDATGEVRYAFRHALVRDAAYNSLLQRHREVLHARIAACLEDHFPDTVASEPERLAEHYSKAGLAERAIRFWRRAGERASERSETLEAQNHFKNGLKLLDGLQDSTAKNELELSLLIGLGPVEIAIGGPGSKVVNNAYERAISLCNELPYSPMHFAAHWGQWRTSRTYLIKHERAEKLSAVTSHLDDPGLSLQAHHCQWAVLFNLGDHDTCCHHVEQGITLYDVGDYRSHAHVYGGHDPAVCGHGQAALSLWLLGFPERAIVRIEKALAIADDLAHAGSMLHAVEIALMFHRFRQDVDKVEALSKRMIALSREEEFAALEVKGALFRDWTLGRRGEVEQAVSGLTAGIAKLRSIDASEDLPFFFDMLAECCVLGGRSEDGLHALKNAHSEVKKTASRFWLAELFRRKGELLLKVESCPEQAIKQAFNSALMAAREQRAKMLELRAATSYAQWFQSKGDTTGALTLLSPVYRGLTEGFDTPDLTVARTLIEELQAGSEQR